MVSVERAFRPVLVWHRSGELPPGERLVIGLNPPFGKNSTLANQVLSLGCDAPEPCCNQRAPLAR